MNTLIQHDFPIITDLHSLFTHDTALLDVRAAIEYQQGAFPHTTNVPLLNNKQRHEIGICYKEQGQDAAILLGKRLLTPEKRQRRITNWQQFIQSNPEGALYCFRGGMRSKISQTWIKEQTGIAYPRVEGGYKAMRRYLIEQSERLIKSATFIIIGGRTGSGKTRVLKQFDNMIDLEGLANHRGSAFGAYATPQPTQINFENNLAIELLKREELKGRPIVLEDEGRNIGTCHLPINLQQKMVMSPIVQIEVSNEERLQLSIQEYAIDMLQDFKQVYGEEQGFAYYKTRILTNLGKIQKRLGGERYNLLKNQVEQALIVHEKTGDAEAHAGWVHALLMEYYDPMYDYQLSKKMDRVVFRGKRAEVIEYLRFSPS
ncbi:MAG TPA: tRNA 2-selenouridine(34) synthase MnmH [Thiothrix sp.]|nr:tRNA 2-selenouridine(34) synthase MnmH [Thiothrix sp.]